MCDCSICNCPGCRKARRDAGFIDSGPYAPLAAARWDQLGPGVYEAGAVPEQRSNTGSLLTIVALAGLVWVLSSKP